MQRLIVDVEDGHINLVVGLLSNLKNSVVKNIVIEKDSSNLKRFRELKSKSNNKTTLTMKIATDTDEMVDDGIL
jgi:hypothetical protein